MISRKDTILIAIAIAGFAIAGSLIASKLQAQPEKPKISNEEHRTNLIASYDTSHAQIELDDLLAPGRIGRDGIPAINDPKLNNAADADFPGDDARVIQVVINDEAVAYPLAILNRHEIVNATVGGTPIAATYCPLCDSVAVFERTLQTDDGPVTLEFGVSGLLYNSNVVMYERTTLALWSQVFMQAVTGPHVGQSLNHLPVNVVSFADFKRDFPNGKVQSPSGNAARYKQNPYDRYFANKTQVYHQFDYDDRLPPKELGVGIRAGKTTVFVPAAAARAKPITINTDLGPITINATTHGVQIPKLPDDALAIQTFYHSWAAFYPTTEIFPQPPPPSDDDSDSSEPSSNDHVD